MPKKSKLVSSEEQDQILLDRIKELENENLKLKSKSKKKRGSILKDISSFVEEVVDFWDFPVLLFFGLFIFCLGGLIVSSTVSEPTGNFYPEYGNFPKIKQEISWGEDDIVWRGDGDETPQEIADKVEEFKKSWARSQGEKVNE